MLFSTLFLMWEEGHRFLFVLSLRSGHVLSLSLSLSLSPTCIDQSQEIMFPRLTPTAILILTISKKSSPKHLYIFYLFISLSMSFWLSNFCLSVYLCVSLPNTPSSSLFFSYCKFPFYWLFIFIPFYLIHSFSLHLMFYSLGQCVLHSGVSSTLTFIF